MAARLTTMRRSDALTPLAPGGRDVLALLRAATTWHRGVPPVIAEARWLQSFATVSAIACIHWYWMPELDPYRPAQSIIVLLLVGGLAGWRRLRPSPSLFAKGYIGLAALMVMGGVHQLTFGDHCRAFEISEIVFRSSLVLTACIYLELWRTWRARQPHIATAIAMRRLARVDLAHVALRRNSSE